MEPEINLNLDNISFDDDAEMVTMEPNFRQPCSLDTVKSQAVKVEQELRILLAMAARCPGLEPGMIHDISLRLSGHKDFIFTIENVIRGDSNTSRTMLPNMGMGRRY